MIRVCVCAVRVVKGSKGKSNLKKFILALNQLFAGGLFLVQQEVVTRTTNERLEQVLWLLMTNLANLILNSDFRNN